MTEMSLTSDAFTNGNAIPRRFGYKNENASPPLRISGIPNGTKSLALIMDDPDAMGAVGKVWVHWLLWNIDPNTTEIKENTIPLHAIEGKTDFNDIGYGGPAPPDKQHTYIFKLYALSEKLNLNKGATKLQLEDAMRNKVMRTATLTGTYAP